MKAQPVQEQQAAQNFSIDPNPVIDHLTVEWLNQYPFPRCSYVIFEPEGKAILAGNLEVEISSHGINVASLAPGNYMLMIVDESRTFWKMHFVKA